MNWNWLEQLGFGIVRAAASVLPGYTSVSAAMGTVQNFSVLTAIQDPESLNSQGDWLESLQGGFQNAGDTLKFTFRVVAVTCVALVFTGIYKNLRS